ncbi:MAG TPA: MarR family transcriptional regulator [Candidatus Thermoplasmatota archaeon]|nr:MarR family transcriptional regulator [Candidatus Thermoplasmatota archaeon]
MTLPRSAITVLGLLATRGPLTHKDIVTAAPIPPRTVRFALTRLLAEGRVLERPSLRDSRQSYYLLPTGDVATEASLAFA